MKNKIIKTVVYGIGGHLETEPNNNVIETIYYDDQELAELQSQITKKAARQAVLDKLGLTADEVAALLG